MTRTRIATGLLLAALLAGGVSIASSIHSADPLDAGESVGPMVGVSKAAAHVELLRLSKLAPPPQARALADLRVSFAEYRSAMESSRECLKDELERAISAELGSGSVTASVSDLTVSDDSFQLGFSYTLRPTEDLDQSKVRPHQVSMPQRLETRCRERYVNMIERGYQVGVLSDGTYVSRAQEQLADCLGRAGVRLAGTPSARAWVIRAATQQGSPGMQSTALRCGSEVPSVLAATGLES